MHVGLAAGFALHGAVAVRVGVFVIIIVLGRFTAADGALPAVYFPIAFWTLHTFSLLLFSTEIIAALRITTGPIN